MITFEEAAKVLGVTSMRVRQMANSRGFMRRIGNVRYLTPEELEGLKDLRGEIRGYARSAGLVTVKDASAEMGISRKAFRILADACGCYGRSGRDRVVTPKQLERIKSLLTKRKGEREQRPHSSIAE